MSTDARARVDGIRILYVEDDEDTRAMMILLLESAGATVVAVGSADAAVAAFEDAQPDVLISDGGLPGRDGRELIAQVRTWSRARGGQTPAITVTGYASDADIRQSLLAGFNVHLSKPIIVEELLRTVARLVGREGIATGATT